ncbi:hypothetical protein F4859DRAFT_518498 [Xylaria cf. heliscus]|nr:hypothetical protein F4859DRAFT_518498 [Xylaria cf. heliscus]
MFPDLRAEAAPTGTPLLRYEVVTDGVMMALIDHEPGRDQIVSPALTQLAHQQRFAIARGVDVDKVTLDIWRQYNVDQSILFGRDAFNKIFFWDSGSGSDPNDLDVIWPPHFANVQF